MTHTTTPQFPGYLLVLESARAMLDVPRWRHHARPMHSPDGGTMLLAPRELEHAMWLEEQSASSPPPSGRIVPWSVGERALLARGPLAAGGATPVECVVEQVRGSRVRVRVDGCTLPVTCSVSDLLPV